MSFSCRKSALSCSKWCFCGGKWQEIAGGLRGSRIKNASQLPEDKPDVRLFLEDCFFKQWCYWWLRKVYCRIFCIICAVTCCKWLWYFLSGPLPAILAGLCQLLFAPWRKASCSIRSAKKLTLRLWTVVQGLWRINNYWECKNWPGPV